MTKFLVPTDFSENARNAFIAALKLAQLFKAEVTLCSVYDQPSTGQSVLRDISEKLYLTTIEDLQQEVEEVQLEFPGMHIPIKAIKGDIAEMIDKTADLGQYDLIMMGKTGRSGLSNKLFGSIALQTIQKANHPLLLIPESWNYKAITKVCLATDLGEINYSESLIPLIAFAEKFKAPVELIHFAADQEELDLIYERGSKAKSDIDSALASINHKFVFGIREDVRKALFEYIDTADFHMMCMIKNEYPWVQELFRSSPTVDAAIHTNVPLLILR